jgi:hypothetical protein
MERESEIKRLLRWRVTCAEAEAPLAPRASQLLRLEPPWWKSSPEQFRSAAERVCQIEIANGHATAEIPATRTGYPVPTLIVRNLDEVETSVCILYFGVRDAILRLRFRLNLASREMSQSYDATFVRALDGYPLLSTDAAMTAECEFTIKEDLANDLAKEWEPLNVTDQMPFRLILRCKKKTTNTT